MPYFLIGFALIAVVNLAYRFQRMKRDIQELQTQMRALERKVN